MTSLHIIYKQTSLVIKTEGIANRPYIEGLLKDVYKDIEGYIAQDNNFLSSLHPVKVLDTAPDIIQQMALYSSLAKVGPMAGIAGAIAEYVGWGLSPFHHQIICNNGGDIFYRTLVEQYFFIQAQGSPFDNKLCICVPPSEDGKGLCTSSGISGHSINMGRAYAVTVLAANACLADVWATAISNIIISDKDIEKGLDLGKNQKGVEGLIILVDNYIGIWGNIRLG